ncbi:MAG: NTPase [Aquificaceae bacterium]
MKVLLTGAPGIGKTTLVKKVAQKLKGKVVGFWTEEVRDRATRKRTGFRIKDTEGNSEVFSSKFFTSKYLVGSYGVNLERFEKVALPIVEKAMRDKERIILIDEVGKMELFSEKFALLVEKVISDPKYNALVTIPIRDIHPLVAQIRRHPSAVLLEITKENRDSLLDEIIGLLTEG